MNLPQKHLYLVGISDGGNFVAQFGQLQCPSSVAGSGGFLGSRVANSRAFSAADATEVCPHAEMHLRWNGVKHVEHEWMREVRVIDS